MKYLEFTDKETGRPVVLDYYEVLEIYTDDFWNEWVVDNDTLEAHRKW